MKKLEKEAEEKTAQYMSEHTEKYNCENTKLETDNYNIGREYGYRDGYLAAAESREKRIEQLEKENAELKEKLEDTEKARDCWKDGSFDWRHKCTSRKPFKATVKAQKRLIKAKALLAKWVELYKPKLEDFPKPPIQVDTEQFLKETEDE